jgi:hypothetical protein
LPGSGVFVMRGPLHRFRRPGQYEHRLLPAWVVRQQNRHRLLTRLAAVQCSIFVLLAVSAGVSDLPARLAFKKAEILRAEINRPSPSPVETQPPSKRIFEALIPAPRFKYERLAEIHAAAPAGADIRLTEMGGENAAVTVISAGLDDMESFRKTLDESGLFSYARFSRIRRTDNGAYQYELMLGWNDAGE